ncbi:MAG: porin [Chitinophagaceae bacterium]|nr:MAG: porin [Chitinophagaceae bacterium]
MKLVFFSLALVALGTSLQAQDTIKPATLTFSGYVEGYYSYDLNKPESNTRPGFLYNYNRHNEVNLNLGFVKASYNTDRVRANLAIGAGTYMNSNYAAEPGVLKNVFEANAGIKLTKTKNLWFDIGIIPSHIGFESATGKDNWATTRSLVAENSPYFQGGARLGYTTDNGKFSASLLALNGWQRITRVDGNSMMSFGSQITVKPSDKVTLNYSTFFGTDKPDSARLFRTYHNVYGIFQLSKFIGITAGFDVGTEEKSITDNSVNTWYTPVAIVRVTPAEKIAFAIRGEYFRDEKGVIIATGTPNGFETVGLSANIDYMPLPNAMLRLEFRNLNNGDRIYVDKSDKAVRSSAAITLSAAISF